MKLKELEIKLYNHFESEVPKDVYMKLYNIPNRYNPTLIMREYLKYLKRNKLTKTNEPIKYIPYFMKQLDYTKIIY
jgi:hypothetical protein